MNAERVEDFKAASDSITQVDSTSAAASINDHPFLQKLLSESTNVGRLANMTVDSTIKKVLVQYFVKNQTSKLSRKFLGGLSGCYEVTKDHLDRCLTMLPDLHDIAKLVSKKKPLSKDESQRAQKRIQYFGFLPIRNNINNLMILV